MSVGHNYWILLFTNTCSEKLLHAVLEVTWLSESSLVHLLHLDSSFWRAGVWTIDMTCNFICIIFCYNFKSCAHWQVDNFFYKVAWTTVVNQTRFLSREAVLDFSFFQCSVIGSLQSFQSSFPKTAKLHMQMVTWSNLATLRHPS